MYLRSSVAGMLPMANLNAELLTTLHAVVGDESSCKEAHVLHKGKFYRSTLGNLQLSGEPALLNLLYHGGMGEMREEGFGLFELNT
jgi:CRISPR/Cas system endoribonuclease Cas6 (RAMP superfamily)